MNKMCLVPVLLLFSYANNIDFTAMGVNGMTVQFYDASILEDNLTINSYLWDFGDGETSKEKDPIHTYRVEGVYKVCLSINGLDPVCKEDTFFITKNGIMVRFDDTVWPNGNISTVSSPFGSRWKKSESRYDFHRGIDIPGNLDDPIVSIADGVVHSAYSENDPDNPFSSTTVVISHQMETPFFFKGKFIKNYYSLSSHLNSISPGIQQGAVVKKGDLIGGVGQTGQTIFNHNHFEIRVGVLCSIESQQNGGCSSSNPFSEVVDPHVNPLLFLDYFLYNTNSLKYEVVGNNPLKIKVKSNRLEIDFNEIEVVSGADNKLINFNDRQGIDPSNIDAAVFEDVGVDAGLYTDKGNEDYEVTFTLYSYSNFDEIRVKDIWNNPSSLSNEPQNDSTLRPYPNPADENIYLTALGENEVFSFQLFDSSGAFVKQGQLNGPIPIENLSSGVYYLKLISHDENSPEIRSYKILKK
ncbi:peptidoglycan DD-metalloendopeptidase family protein [Flagellimonas pacifica]|nr:peptidoglycan DD-metalloendopeptidase family protein [Allomuricauda parva]